MTEDLFLMIVCICSLACAHVENWKKVLKPLKMQKKNMLDWGVSSVT